MDYKQAQLEGFVKQAAKYGWSTEDAVVLFKQAAVPTWVDRSWRALTGGGAEMAQHSAKRVSATADMAKKLEQEVEAHKAVFSELAKGQDIHEATKNQLFEGNPLTNHSGEVASVPRSTEFKNMSTAERENFLKQHFTQNRQAQLEKELANTHGESSILDPLFGALHGSDANAAPKEHLNWAVPAAASGLAASGLAGGAYMMSDNDKQRS